MHKFKILILFLIFLVNIQNPTLAAKDDILNVGDAASVGSAKIYPYFQRTVYIIYCHPDRIVDIELQPGEKFTYVGGADTVRWNIDQELMGGQWHVFVKPNIDDPNLSTSFIIGTDRHIYHVEAFNAKSKYTPIIAWNYPQSERLEFKTNNQMMEENNIFVSSSLDEVNFDYKICSAKTNARPTYPWTPIMVFDDGKKTYIKMPEEMNSSEAPVLFAKDKEIKKKKKGETDLLIVNYRLKNGYFIVDQVMDEFQLHSGEKSIVRIIRLNK